LALPWRRWPDFPIEAGIGNNSLNGVTKGISYKESFLFGLTLTDRYVFILFIPESSFFKPATPNPKGWSMKQSFKTPFFEKKDGGV
jgi:hypothetical protein